VTEPAEVAPGIRVFPVRTPTLPPATHTNVWVVGQHSLTVIDPASPWTEGQDALFEHLQSLDRPVDRLVLTHHHADHIGGIEDLSRRLGGVEICAHPLTAERIGVPVDTLWEGGIQVECGGNTLSVHHTPGHAPGHLVFLDQASKMLVAGDMVAGVGTIVIQPGDGHLGSYLHSLERLRALGPTALLPAHGPVLHEADSVLAFYIAHRNMRTEQIRSALDTLGKATALELAPHVYAELDPRFHPMAAVQITSHLIFLEEGGFASMSGDRWGLGGD